MTTPIRTAIVAVAVLVVALLGYQFLPRSGGIGGHQTQGTPPTASTPTAPPASGGPPVGDLAPGRYGWTAPRSCCSIAPPSGSLTFEVPFGWAGLNAGADISKHADSAGEIVFGLWLTPPNPEVTHVYADACRSEGSLKPIGTTVDELVTAIQGQLSTDAVVSDVSVAGRPATRIDLTETEGLDRAPCRHGADGPLQIWADPNETTQFALAPGNRGVIYVFDTAVSASCLRVRSTAPPRRRTSLSSTRSSSRSGSSDAAMDRDRNLTPAHVASET